MESELRSLFSSTQQYLLMKIVQSTVFYKRLCQRLYQIVFGSVPVDLTNYETLCFNNLKIN